MQPQEMLAPKYWNYHPKYSLITTRLQDTIRIPVAFCCASENTNYKLFCVYRLEVHINMVLSLLFCSV